MLLFRDKKKQICFLWHINPKSTMKTDRKVFCWCIVINLADHKLWVSYKLMSFSEAQHWRYSLCFNEAPQISPKKKETKEDPKKGPINQIPKCTGISRRILGQRGYLQRVRAHSKCDPKSKPEDWNIHDKDLKQFWNQGSRLWSLKQGTGLTSSRYKGQKVF